MDFLVNIDVNDLDRAIAFYTHAFDLKVGRRFSKTEAFIKAVKAPVHIPLSGKTMEFDAGGKCTAGC